MMKRGKSSLKDYLTVGLALAAAPASGHTILSGPTNGWETDPDTILIDAGLNGSSG